MNQTYLSRLSEPDHLHRIMYTHTLHPLINQYENAKIVKIRGIK